MLKTNKRIIYIIICILLLSVLVGCKKEESLPRNAGAYINTKGERVSDIYNLSYDFLKDFDDRGIATLCKDDSNGGKKYYYLDKDFNVIGNRLFEVEQSLLLEYDGKDIFYVKTDSGIDILDEVMNPILSIPYDMGDDVGIMQVIAPIGSNGWIGIKDSASEKWGYIDLEGKTVIDYAYSYVSGFSDDGVAIVKADNDLWGVINEQGDYVIEPRYAEISDFSCGRALAKEDPEGPVKLIDLDGNIVSENSFGICSDISYCDGLASVVDASTGLYGFIDIDGNYVIEPKYEIVRDFFNVYTRVYDGTDDYVIDKQGEKLIVDGAIACGRPSEEGLVPALKDGLYGYYSINTNEWVIEPQFPSEDIKYFPGEFHNGYAWVCLN